MLRKVVFLLQTIFSEFDIYWVYFSPNSNNIWKNVIILLIILLCDDTNAQTCTLWFRTVMVSSWILHLYSYTKLLHTHTHTRVCVSVCVCVCVCVWAFIDSLWVLFLLTQIGLNFNFKKCAWMIELIMEI